MAMNSWQSSYWKRKKPAGAGLEKQEYILILAVRWTSSHGRVRSSYRQRWINRGEDPWSSANAEDALVVETGIVVNPVDPLITTVENETASGVGDMAVGEARPVGESIATDGEGEVIEELVERVIPVDGIDVVEK